MVILNYDIMIHALPYRLTSFGTLADAFSEKYHARFDNRTSQYFATISALALDTPSLMIEATMLTL